MSDRFRPRSGTRYPRRVDRLSSFEAAGLLNGRLTLDKVFEYHEPRSNAFARHHAREVVTLEAMDDPDLIAWYCERGFEREGPPLTDSAWGRLFPMVKRVARWPGGAQ